MIFDFIVEKNVFQINIVGMKRKLSVAITFIFGALFLFIISISNGGKDRHRERER